MFVWYKIYQKYLYQSEVYLVICHWFANFTIISYMLLVLTVMEDKLLFFVNNFTNIFLKNELYATFVQSFNSKGFLIFEINCVCCHQFLEIMVTSSYVWQHTKTYIFHCFNKNVKIKKENESLNIITTFTILLNVRVQFWRLWWRHIENNDVIIFFLGELYLIYKILSTHQV